MSNAGQAVLGIVGGIIGFAVGGPTGALYGFQIGLAVGTVVSPTQLPGTFGPKLGDKRTTTAQLGEPIPEVFGTDVVSGTVIWLGDVVEHANTEEVGGKGAPVGENTTYTYTQSIAIGLCRGPKFGVLRIWENGELVYDARPQMDVESYADYLQRFNAAGFYASKFTLYLGDEDQEPDPTIELKEGIGNVPGYRGLMYIVFTDRELRNDQGQRHPSFKFEVGSAEISDLRQAPSVTLESSVILRAGTDGGSTTGYTTVLGSFGELFDPEIIGAPGFFEIAGGYTTDVVRIIYSSGLGFFLAVEGRFHNMLKKVEYTGEIIVDPVIYDSPTDEQAVAQGSYFQVNPTSETPFVSGEDYLLTLTSEIPAGRLSFCSVDVEEVFPGFPFSFGIKGYNREALYGGSSGAGDFGEFTGTVDVGLETEIEVWAFYLIGTPGPGATFRVILQGNRTGLELVVTLTGAAGAVIFGPLTPAIIGSGIQTASRYEWVGEDDMFVDGATYEVTFRTVGVLPFVPYVDPGVSLTSIVQTLCERCSLGDAVDVTDLDGVAVHGYKIDRLTDGRSAIAVLRQIGFFDAVENNVVKFVRRGHEAARTLNIADLGAHEYGASEVPPSVITTSTQEVELPRQLFVTYRDPARDYEDGQQASPTRLITEAVNDKYIEISAAIAGTQALRAAEVLWADEWAGRWRHTIALDASHADLEPTDVVLVPVDGRLERLRIVGAEESAIVLRKLQLVRDDDGSYVSDAIAEPPARTPATLKILAGTSLVLLDLPPLRVEDNDAGIYVAAQRTATGNSWGGASVYRGLPSAALTQIASLTNEAVIGVLSLPLGSGLHTVFDDANTIVVELPRGQFDSRSDADLLELGANTLAIGDHGRWELVQFGDAQQLGPTSWALSHLLRGRRGTDNNIGSALAGDTIALVSGVGVLRLALPASDAGTELVYRGVTIGATLPTGLDQSFTSGGQALKPFSPVHVTATDVAGDLLIAWTRRDRLAIEFEPGPLPLSETSEAYVVEILDDASPPNVLRTLATSSASVTYTAAQQFDDFGSPVPDGIHIKIYQLGQLGRGTPREAFI